MIWLVTDHPDTRTALPPLIARLGYSVHEIDCGDEVLKRLPFQKPRLIILDCGLRDSFSLIGRIRSDAQAAPTPILMFSTGSEDLRETAMLKGADAYVPKGSLDWAELLAEITRFAGPPNARAD